MREQQQEPLTLVEYYRTLPHWRKKLCYLLERRARQTGLTFGVWLYRAVNDTTGFRLYKTMRDVGWDAGYWISVVVSGYPWNNYRKAQRSQSEKPNEERLFDDGVMTLGEYLETLPAWRRTLSLLLSLIKTQWGYLLFLWVSGYPSNKYRSMCRNHKNSGELERERLDRFASDLASLKEVPQVYHANTLLHREYSLITRTHSQHLQEKYVQTPSSEVLCELDLGGYLLIIRADNSIELCDLCDEARSGTGMALVLNPEEAYRLFISLKEVFK